MALYTAHAQYGVQRTRGRKIEPVRISVKHQQVIINYDRPKIWNCTPFIVGWDCRNTMAYSCLPVFMTHSRLKIYGDVLSIDQVLKPLTEGPGRKRRTMKGTICLLKHYEMIKRAFWYFCLILPSIYDFLCNSSLCVACYSKGYYFRFCIGRSSAVRSLATHNHACPG